VKQAESAEKDKQSCGGQQQQDRPRHTGYCSPTDHLETPTFIPQIQHITLGSDWYARIVLPENVSPNKSSRGTLSALFSFIEVELSSDNWSRDLQQH
jgi:hypothetical protein